MSEVWVVSRETSRDNGTLIGVTRTLQRAKELAAADWADPHRSQGRPFGEWGSSPDGDQWTADVSVLDYYQIQRFELIEDGDEA